MVSLAIDLVSSVMLIATVHQSHTVHYCTMPDCSGKRRFVLDARQRRTTERQTTGAFGSHAEGNSNRLCLGMPVLQDMEP